MRIISKFILLFFLLISFAVRSQDIPKPMSPPRLLNDFSQIFSPQEKSNLETMLKNYNDTTSTQIYVVTVDDLQGYAVSDYAFRLGQEWGIGQKGKDNGAVILIKPKIGNSRGQVFIAVGYGLEEKLTDARIGRIIDNDMIPSFRNDDYYSGTELAVKSMIKYLSGQFQNDEDDQDGASTFDVIILILIIVLVIYLSGKSKNNRGNRSNRGGGFFPPIGGRGFGGGSSSGRSFGGGGGGSFGGGGAGRSW